MHSHLVFNLFQPHPKDSKKKYLHQLDLAAEEYFSKASPQKIPSVTSLDDLLKTSFIVAEQHYHISPKSFLISNMSLLKKAGFNTLFMEALYVEHQSALDNFCLQSDSPPLTNKVREHLANLDGNNFYQPNQHIYDLSKRWQANNYSALIQAAKQAGIRVVGIDTKKMHTFALENMLKDLIQFAPKRIKYMNFMAAHIIKEIESNTKLNEKWLFLTGAFHAATLDPAFPGMSELLSVPSVYIEDTEGFTLNQQILYNVSLSTEKLCPADKKQVVDVFPVKEITFHVYLTNNPFKDIFLLHSPTISNWLECKEDQSVFTENQFNEAVNNYLIYKNKYMGLRWFKASCESRKTIHNIILADNGQERSAIAKDYITRNPRKAFSLQLQKTFGGGQVPP